MAITSCFTLCFLLLLLATTATTSTPHNHYHRHLLHQPLIPLTPTATPPTQPPYYNAPQSQPQPQKTQPKLPFSNTPQQTQRPFFPSYTSSSPPPPPPPSLSSLATFPANISSLLFPHSHSPSSSHRRLAITLSVSLSLLFVAILLILSALCIYARHHTSSTTTTNAAAKTDNLSLFPPNTVHSDTTRPPKLRHGPGVPNTNSSELLYLGTLSSSRARIDSLQSQSASVGVRIGVSSSSTSYQKLGSPELKPLPPLPKLNTTPFTSGEALIASNKEELEVEMESGTEEEQFFSPIGSSDRKDSNFDLVQENSVRVGSSSRREIHVQGENFGSRSFNSRTASYPYSNPLSPASSVSTSPSLVSNSSARISNSKSPDVIISYATQSRSIARSVSSSSSSGNTRNSPQQRIDSSAKISPTMLPPPPPPPPPPRFWENPVEVREAAGTSGPPRHVSPARTKLRNEEVNGNGNVERTEETPKPKLKPLHWDKVRASSDRIMVWDQIKSSSFQLNEEMIETLFMVSNNSNMSNGKDNNGRRQSWSPGGHENRVLDPKKSQNIAILLRALNVTIDEVCEALMEGNADTIGTELLESLLKMAPSKEEEQKLQELKDDSPLKLGPAEKFLKAVIDIPFAFKRVEAMLYIANFDTELEYIRRSFETLEAACQELRNSRMFLKLLDAVLKTGNRMNVGTNRGDAQAFKLDTLLKLVDVKGADGKTTLLHFVVQEIIRSEGLPLSALDKNQPERIQQSAFRDEVEFRKLGLQVVSGLSGELGNVKKAAAMDSDVLCSEVANLAAGIAKIKEVLQLNEVRMLKGSSSKFSESMNGFLKKAEEEIVRIQAQETVVLSLVKEVTEYFHGNLAKEEAHPFRIFVIVRDFLCILDHVCKEVGKINDRIIYSSVRPVPTIPTIPPVFPGLDAQHHASYDENPSLLL